MVTECGTEGNVASQTCGRVGDGVASPRQTLELQPRCGCEDQLGQVSLHDEALAELVEWEDWLATQYDAVDEADELWMFEESCEKLQQHE